VELALFRILQESLTNVHRHSGSPTVEIGIEVDAEIVSLVVRDAGRGIPQHVMEQFRESGTAGIGLAGMRERLADLGGELRVQSGTKGTLLQATIPLHGGTLRQPRREFVA
jgi:signal transduction histidine kinase